MSTRSNVNHVELPPRVGEALHWITSILEEESIEYQLAGGAAARFYGATREINDIDIDIKYGDFPRLLARVGAHLVREPEVQIDSEWIVFIAKLLYRGQAIEVSNADQQQIFDEASSLWVTFNYNLADVFIAKWEERPLRLMPPKKLLIYKRLLHGDHQAHDISAIQSFVASDAAL